MKVMAWKNFYLVKTEEKSDLSSLQLEMRLDDT